MPSVDIGILCETKMWKHNRKACIEKIFKPKKWYFMCQWVSKCLCHWLLKCWSLMQRTAMFKFRSMNIFNDPWLLWKISQWQNYQLKVITTNYNQRRQRVIVYRKNLSTLVPCFSKENVLALSNWFLPNSAQWPLWLENCCFLQQTETLTCGRQSVVEY